MDSIFFFPFVADLHARARNLESMMIWSSFHVPKWAKRAPYEFWKEDFGGFEFKCY